MLGKPGMGVDEGVMIVNNEQQRLLAVKWVDGTVLDTIWRIEVPGGLTTK